MIDYPGNYFFVPYQGRGLNGKLYRLGSKSYDSTNCLALIPYHNPAKHPATPKYYPILSVQELEETALNTKDDPSQKIILRARINKKTYIEKVKQLKQHIQLGNIYEINYCIEFFADDVIIEPLVVFKRLQELTKAPYASLLKLDNDYIISASPELWIKKEGTKIESKPIKGTSRRGKDEMEDLELKEALHNNIKERTENVMAVDVARNDLSRFAKKGSVSVNKLYNIETFETVHQMVSTVSCELKGGKNFDDILDAAFPMASMTGAPKIKAMELIDEFENFERNHYSGAMGLIDEKGDFTLSVIIRSIFYNSLTKHLSISVGGAITYLSEPEKEYEECMLKAKALLKALNSEIKPT